MGLFDKLIANYKADYKEKEAATRALHEANQRKKADRKAGVKPAAKKPAPAAPTAKRSAYVPVQDHVLPDYTYIKDTTLKSSAAMQNLGELVCPSVPPDKRTPQMLVSGAKSLLDTLSAHADKFYADAIAAADPVTFFDCIDACDRDYSRMSCIEEYVQYGGRPSNIAKYHMDERLQIEVRHLIDRMAAAAKEAPDPDAAMKEAYQQLKKFEKRMDEQSLKKLNSKFKKYVN